MEKIKDEHFECIKEDNSEEEDEKQWKRSKIIFDHAWFEMRLKTYFEAQGDDFYEWIQEYNYDF